MSGFFFIIRKMFAWGIACGAFMLALGILSSRTPHWIFFFLSAVAIVYAAILAYAHVHRVRLVAGQVDSGVLARRHRRQIDLPLEAGEVFDIVEAAVRELPHVKDVQAARDSLQLRARVKAVDPYTGKVDAVDKYSGMKRGQPAQILATVTPRDGASSVTLLCEPEGPAWLDWYLMDDGANYENAEAIARAVTRRVAERRKGEQDRATATATEKELAVARLSLLHAQVEPHFLYNTLASAQILARTDPPRAERMLGHLIDFLRNSLPSADDALSSLGSEVERAKAYLEILKIRMGDRLNVQVDVPLSLAATPLPPMMVQTLVENAIKHGLEPQPAGGTVWVLAREDGGKVSLTVADDGRGFHADGGGTGIGLKNIRERLRLAYGDAASFTIVANFPAGVAATLTVPRAGPTLATRPAPAFAAAPVAGSAP